MTGGHQRARRFGRGGRMAQRRPAKKAPAPPTALADRLEDAVVIIVGWIVAFSLVE